MTFDVRFARFEAHDVRLLKHQLGNIFDRDDSLGFRNEPREGVQQGRFAASTAARDDGIEPCPNAASEKLEHRCGQSLVGDQFVITEDASSKPADRQRRTIQRHRRNRGGDARPIRQASRDNRIRLIDSAPGRRDHFFDDVQEVFVVLELNRGTLQQAAPFDVNLVVVIHQDVGDRRVFQDGLQRAEPEHFIKDLLDDAIALRQRHWNVFLKQEFSDGASDFAAQPFLADEAKGFAVQ